MYGGRPGGSGSRLSPRVRGNHQAAGIVAVVVGSIPACAGEPGTSKRSKSPAKVYPRVCGGTGGDSGHGHAADGLSPRVRGNPGCGGLLLLLPWSIPACAGEPARRPTPPAAPPVYPRVCGGTRMSIFVSRTAIGLSPRVRGNREQVYGWHAVYGSIPACAGEPTSQSCA